MCSTQQRTLVIEWLRLVPDLQAKFQEIDANGDGVVSRSELERAVAPFEAKWRALPAALQAMSGSTAEGIPLEKFLALGQLLQGNDALRRGMLHRLKVILAPPGAGKTTFLSSQPRLNYHGRPVADADDVLRDVKDKQTGKDLLASMDYYLRTPGLGWDKWHRVCFRAIIKAQHERSLGLILCGFRPVRFG